MLSLVTLCRARAIRQDGLALSKGPLPCLCNLSLSAHGPSAAWNNLSVPRILTFPSLYAWIPDAQNDARLVVVSSSAHYEAKGVPLSLQGVNAQRDVGGFNAYAESKLANLLFAQQVRNHHTQQGVHPLRRSWPFLIQSQSHNLWVVNHKRYSWPGPEGCGFCAKL
jgi:hypothetical protein